MKTKSEVLAELEDEARKWVWIEIGAYSAASATRAVMAIVKQMPDEQSTIINVLEQRDDWASRALRFGKERDELKLQVSNAEIVRKSLYDKLNEVRGERDDYSRSEAHYKAKFERAHKAIGEVAEIAHREASSFRASGDEWNRGYARAMSVVSENVARIYPEAKPVKEEEYILRVITGKDEPCPTDKIGTKREIFEALKKEMEG